MAISPSKLIVKFISSLLLFSIIFTVKTFTEEFQTQLIFATMLNSTHAIITLFNEGEDINYWSPSSFHNGHPNQMKSNQIKCWFLVRGENRSTRGKTSHSRVENQQTQPTYDAECGNRTRATLVEGKCSHH